jgi:hypothetical protein
MTDEKRTMVSKSEKKSCHGREGRDSINTCGREEIVKAKAAAYGEVSAHDPSEDDKDRNHA